MSEAEKTVCFNTEDGGRIVCGRHYMMIFGPDNSQTRPIRDILVFHHLEGDERYILLRDVWKTLSLLGEGLIHADNTAMIEYGHGLDTIPKTVESITGQLVHYERDILLLLMPAEPEIESVILKTKDGLIFIGPNDGRLGFIRSETIVGARRITGPAGMREETRRVFAAAKIVAAWPLDKFSESIDFDQLVTI